MFDFACLPSSMAKPLDKLSLPKRYIPYTFTGFIDEEALFTEINKKLTELETSNDANHSELEFIIRLTAHFHTAQEKKEELLIRIDWMKRLYEAKTKIVSMDTKTRAEEVRNLISPVQTCPMKNTLMAELDSFEQQFKEEAIGGTKQSKAQILMEKAIKEVGDIFVNLGKAGRDFVIANVLQQYGDESCVDDVKKCTIILEQRVQFLKKVTERIEMLPILEQIPLPSFSILEPSRKERVAELLMEKSDWDSLLSLDRKISQLVEYITKTEWEEFEREHTIKLQNGSVVAPSFNERHIGKIELSCPSPSRNAKMSCPNNILPLLPKRTNCRKGLTY